MPGLRSAARTAPGGGAVLPRGVQLRPWRAGDGRAHLVVGPAAPMTPRAVDACIEHARRRGYRGIVTSALAPPEQAPFVSRGFAVRERLHFLACDVAGSPDVGTDRLAIRRVRRREHGEILALDELAFPTAWRLGPAGLQDALRATPSRQFRCAGADGSITGYAITGFGGRHAYLQRLATHPDAQRRGVGRALVLDALQCSWARGASRCFVNTQLDNTAALVLYESVGFERVGGGLALLERTW